MGAFDSDTVIAGTEFEIQRFKIPVSNATIDMFAVNRGITTHTQAGDTIIVEHQTIIRDAVAIVNTQAVDLFIFVN